jgi:hypothetical protein
LFVAGYIFSMQFPFLAQWFYYQISRYKKAATELWLQYILILYCCVAPAFVKRTVLVTLYAVKENIFKTKNLPQNKGKVF